MRRGVRTILAGLLLAVLLSACSDGGEGSGSGSGNGGGSNNTGSLAGSGS